MFFRSRVYRGCRGPAATALVQDVGRPGRGRRQDCFRTGRQAGTRDRFSGCDRLIGLKKQRVPGMMKSSHSKRMNVDRAMPRRLGARVASVRFREEDQDDGEHPGDPTQ